MGRSTRQHNAHEIDEKYISQIPKKLWDPYCIIDNPSNPGSVLAILDIDLPDKENGGRPAKILLPFEVNYYDRKKKVFFNRVKDVSPKLVSSIERYITAYSVQQYMEEANPGQIYYVSKNLSANLERSAQLQLLSSVIEKSALLRESIAQKYTSVNRAPMVYSQVSTEENTLVGGLPPRVRGVLCLSGSESANAGITPARAGRTLILLQICSSFGDYPRACGAYSAPLNREMMYSPFCLVGLNAPLH